MHRRTNCDERGAVKMLAFWAFGVALAGGVLSCLPVMALGGVLIRLLGDKTNILTFLLPALPPIALSPFVAKAWREWDFSVRRAMVVQFIVVWYIGHWLPLLLLIACILIFGWKM
ncbi:MAG: hypothetical protein HZB26_16075 [Candidatus Hydrogenedentes bacterium]|nr:hypothetical protein [Candidatus Hydrogenedentota bacterium]